MSTDKGNTGKDVSDLKLAKQDRAGDLLFLIGTILAIISTYQIEKSVLNKSFKQVSEQKAASPTSNPANTIAVFSWIFLLATIIFTNSASERLKEQKARVNQSTSLSGLKNFKGTQIAAFGTYIKLIGFAIVAIANQIKADNPED